MKTFLLLLSSLAYLEAASLVGDFPTYKTWWAKKVISQDIYTARKLTETQIKYVWEAGFPSMIAMFYYTSPVYIGEEVVPTGDREADIARNLLGMQFQHILSPGANDWRSLDTVRTFAKAYENMKKPVLFHCGSSYSATATVLMYFLNQTKHFPDAEPKVDLNEFFKQSEAMGLDYGSDTRLMELVREILDTENITIIARPKVTIPKWNSKYWLVRPIYDNWYAAGQIRLNYLPMIEHFQIVANLRDGSTIPRPEVTLLNVKDNTGEARQKVENLERNRIEPSRPTWYIGPNSTINFQTHNNLEFGDNIGYNEKREKNKTEETKIEYVNLPNSPRHSAFDKWQRHRQVLLNLGRSKTAILIHSRNSEDAVFLSLLAAGCKHGFNSAWALNRAERLGFHWKLSTHYDVVSTIKLVLNRPKMC